MRSFKYIIKRILIGTGIALLLGFIRGSLITSVYASQISPLTWNGMTWDTTSGVSLEQYDVPVTAWVNHGNGILRFSVSITKTGGSSTAPIIVPRMISAYSGSSRFVCDIGSNVVSNSTWVANTYSVSCPMNLGPSGVTSILLAFSPFSTETPLPTYRIQISPDASFEVFDNTNVNVNVDTSSTTSAINNQINNDNTNTNSIINNQNSNTNSIINNQNTNTNSIINNQNQTTQDIINGKCSNSETALSFDTSGYYDENGAIVSNSSWTSTTQLKNGLDKIVIVKGNVGSSTLVFRIVEYDQNNQLIGVTYYNSSQEITLNKKHFYRFSKRNPGLESYNVYVCSTGLSDLNSSITDVNSTLNNDNVTGASTEANSFFSNFNHDSHGLSGIITAPLRLIDTFTTATCSPLTFNLPFVHDTVTLPCMRGIYEQHFGVFFSLYQLITTGIICYGVMINMYSKIHALQNPNNDRIEVLNL